MDTTPGIPTRAVLPFDSPLAPLSGTGRLYVFQQDYNAQRMS